MQLRKDLPNFLSPGNFWFTVPFVILILGYGLLYSRLYNVLNPDMVAYFSIARHYQRLDFVTAFNSYWSPLICWIMAFIPGLDSNPLTIFRWINVVLGFILFFQLRFWVRLSIGDITYRLFAYLVLVLMILHYSLYTGTPDFLSVVCFFWFLKSLYQMRNTYGAGVFTGLTILIAFFSKSFLLPLCVSLSGFYWFYEKIKNRKTESRFLLSAFITLALGLFLWASCLKQHYGFYTLGSSFSFNSSFDISDQIKIRDLPYEKALFMWEDPYYLHVKPGFFWLSEENFRQTLDRWKTHLNVTVYIFRYFSYLWLGVLFIPLVGFWLRSSRRKKINQFLWLVLAMNWLGYFLVLLLERYLTIGHFSMVLGTFGFSALLWEYAGKWRYIKYLKVFFGIILLVSFAKNPIQENWHEQSKVDQMALQMRASKKLAATGIVKNKRIAAFSNGTALYDYSGFVCYFGGGHYLGESRIEQTPGQQQEEFRSHQVDLVLHPLSLKNELPDWVKKYPVVYEDVEVGAMVIRLNPPLPCCNVPRRGSSTFEQQTITFFR